MNKNYNIKSIFLGALCGALTPLAYHFILGLTVMQVIVWLDLMSSEGAGGWLLILDLFIGFPIIFIISLVLALKRKTYFWWNYLLFFVVGLILSVVLFVTVLSKWTF